MANLSHGMNIGQVRSLVTRLNSQSGEIDQLIGKIDSTLQHLGQNWSGPDFNQFNDWWNSQHKPAMKQLAEKVRGLATSASRNADRQQETSDHA